jgi:hypothetical protein
MIITGYSPKSITAKICEVNIFCTLVEFFSPPPSPQELPHTTVDIPTKFHEVSTFVFVCFDFS